jgi:hypothetical protein
MGKHVRFNDCNPVTEISKPLAAGEELLFVQFDCHMRKCSLCRINNAPCITPARLCDRGHRLANRIRRGFFCKKGKLYHIRERGKTLMRAEIPPAQQYICQILTESERPLQVPSQVPPKSFGKRRYTGQGTSSSSPCAYLRTAIPLPSPQHSTMITTTTMTRTRETQGVVTQYYRFECSRVRQI